MEQNNNCGNCKWFARREEVCTNGDSEYVADFVEKDHSCVDWEGKGCE